MLSSIILAPPNLLTNIWICNYFRTLLSNLLTCIRYDLIPIHSITHSDRHKCNHVDRNDTFMMLPVCMLASLPPRTPPPTNNLSKWVDHMDLTLVLNYEQDNLFESEGYRFLAAGVVVISWFNMKSCWLPNSYLPTLIISRISRFQWSTSLRLHLTISLFF